MTSIGVPDDISVAVPEDFAAGRADTVKVMLWEDFAGMQPKCAADTKTVR